jgi:cobalt/nickel transport system permease protein
MAVLTSTTKFPTLLKAFERLKMPKVMLMIISFMYRYIFVITDEMMSMKRARDSRAFGGSIVWHTKTAGAIIGTLFVRSYERAERVYLAMASRGFTGTIKVLEDFKISKLDFLFSIPFFFCLVFIHIWPVL